MLHTLLIAFAIVGSIAAIVSVLIIITKRDGRRKSQQLQNTYSALLVRHDLTPEYVQKFKHRIFAIDLSRKIFVFVQHDEAQPMGIVELSEIRECHLWKDGLQISRKSSNRKEAYEEYLSAVGISFIRKSGVVVTIPVYTESLDGIEEKIALTKTADLWLQKLQELIPGNLQQRS